MNDNDRERRITTEEIDRTGRDQQVAPGRGFDASDAKPAPPGLETDDAPGDGVDSADFPGTAAP